MYLLRCPKLALNNLKYILAQADLKAIRLVLSIGSLTWAVMWAVHSSDDGTFMAAHYTSYTSMMKVMSPTWWAIMFFLHAIFSSVGLLLKRSGKIFIILDSVLGAILWTVTTSLILSTFIILGAWPPAMFSTHAIIAAFAWWVLVRNDYDN